MQVGVVPVLSGHSGSIYQYSLNLLTALYQMETEDRFILFTEDRGALGFLGDERPGWQVRPLEPFSARRMLWKFLRKLAGRGPVQKIWDVRPPVRTLQEFEEEEEEVFDPDVVDYHPERGRWFARAGADIMLYPAPSILSFESGMPFLVALHDLKFRLYSEYPQWLRPDTADMYEYMIRNAARYAALILVDSEAAKADVLEHCGPFGVAGDSVIVLPLAPAVYLDVEAAEDEVQTVLGKYGLVEPYLFFPAAFLPHKNHDRLVEAVDLLRNEYKLPVHVVFCGSSSGDVRGERSRQIVDLVHDRDLEDRVRFLGHVPDEDMSALYSGARIVADLTLHGTASFVVQEAWAFGKPVVASGIRGFREYVGDAGKVVNPLSVEDIAEGIRKLWTEPATRAALAEQGLKRHQSFTIADFSRKLADILREARARMESREES